MVTPRHVIMKTCHDTPDQSEQVYSDRFMDYDYAWNLVNWLNRSSDTHTYYLEESP